MSLRRLIFTFVCAFFQTSFAQIDTSIITWDKILYEVYTTKQDSFKLNGYYEKKEPFFKSYFSRLSQNELDSLNNKCLEVMKATRGDSLQYPQYVANVEYYWNMNRMLFGIDLKKSLSQLNEYYDSFGDTIHLEFIVNGNLIQLHDNFKIYYILNAKRKNVEAQVLKNAFLAPDIGNDTIGKVVFEYEKKIYDITLFRSFQSLKKEVKLTLIYDTKPYKSIVVNNKELSFIVEDVRSYLDKQENMIGVFYVKTTRFGVCRIDCFKKESDYFKNGKRMMRNKK